MNHQMRSLTTGAAFALLVLLALPAAADSVIYSGIDLWVTKADGKTYADFASNPLPAGFFCSKSQPFTGRIILKGASIATSSPGELGRTDTIVHRLDDAVFNKRGVATTRIQVRALQLESVAPVKTACGLFNVHVTLEGEQPVTRMRIVRDHENGGRFLAPIALNVKFSFTPVSGKARERLEARERIVFPVNPRAAWSSKPGLGGVEKSGFVVVDTDGDRRPDTFLPGTSNFAAGWISNPNKTEIIECGEICHDDAESVHCVEGQ